MVKRIALVYMIVFSVISSVYSQNLLEEVAHSVEDWDAAGGFGPAQGFRNWYFGYYEQTDDPSTFREQYREPKKNKEYWGDGNFTTGAIFRTNMTWSTSEKKYNVVRRWVVPEDGQYMVELEGSHKLKVDGKEVEWSRGLTLYVNGKQVEQLRIPGKVFLKREFTFDLKKGDKLDYSAQSAGGDIQLTIRIGKMQSGLLLVSNKASLYKIVIPEADPGAIAEKSAQLLQRLIRESTGVELPIVRETQQDEVAKGFYIGRTKKALSKGIIPDTLKEEEYINCVRGADVFLAGVNKETCVNGKTSYRQGDYKAVCAFLEKELGARFVLPGKKGEVVPRKDSLIIHKNLDRRHCASFPHHISGGTIRNNRDEFEPYATASNLIDRNDMRYFYGHSWPAAVSAAEYGKTHPEYFILSGGKRHPEKGGPQLCIGNREVQALIRADMEKAFEAGYGIYQLSQSDGFIPCECEECAKIGKNPWERIWNFHYALAMEMYKKYPNKQINILSYDITQEPPVWLKDFPPNVIIEMTKYDAEEFEKWKSFAVPKMVYHYNWGEYHELGYLPKRTPLQMSEQLKRFKKNNVVNIFSDAYATSFNGLEAPAVYVYNKLLDDVDINPESLLSEYCQASFGEKTAPFLYNFFNIMFKHMESHSENAYFTTNDKKLVRTPENMISAHFPPTSVRLMEDELAKAEKMQLSPEEQLRLKNVRLHFDYLKSMVKTVSAFRLFQLSPTREVFGVICDGLRERERAIDAIIASELPRAWKSFKDVKSKKVYLTGGSLIGVLGAPFTWDYKNMEKTGRLPLIKNREGVALYLRNVPKDAFDPIWNSLPENKLEKVSGGAADLYSSFKIGWTDKALYLRFQAEAPGIGEKVYNSAGHDNYIGTECFDIFLNPTRFNDRYYQFIFSPAPNSSLDGTMNIDKFGADPLWNKLDKTWNGGWTYSFNIDKENNSWTAMLKIPVSSLGAFVPKEGQSVTMNVGRIHTYKNYLWSPNPETDRFGNIQAFGRITFQK